MPRNHCPVEQVKSGLVKIQFSYCKSRLLHPELEYIYTYTYIYVFKVTKYGNGNKRNKLKFM